LQILANALPGFRDVRAPLVAGYMWLLFAWLLAEPHLHKNSGGVAGSAYELSQDVGPIWTGVAVGAAAYLIGAISQSTSAVFRWTATLLPSYLRPGASDLELVDSIRSTVERAEKLVNDPDSGIPRGSRRPVSRELRRREEQALHEVQRELDLPATLLVGRQSELFAEVDRLRAEGELRMAVVCPLVALAGLCAGKASLWWLLLLPAALTLLIQGLQREADSRKLIADATRTGRLDASSVSKFDKWVDESLPAELNQLRKDVPA
jgi:hypothetical protein